MAKDQDAIHIYGSDDDTIWLAPLGTTLPTERRFAAPSPNLRRKTGSGADESFAGSSPLAHLLRTRQRRPSSPSPAPATAPAMTFTVAAVNQPSSAISLTSATLSAWLRVTARTFISATRGTSG